MLTLPTVALAPRNLVILAIADPILHTTCCTTSARSRAVFLFVCRPLPNSFLFVFAFQKTTATHNNNNNKKNGSYMIR